MDRKIIAHEDGEVKFAISGSSFLNDPMLGALILESTYRADAAARLNPYTWYLQCDSVQRGRKLLLFPILYISHEDVLKWKSTYGTYRSNIWPPRADERFKRPSGFRANGKKRSLRNWREPLYHALVGIEAGRERNA